jgi:anaerobic magnesium-protoporphyrin IX monomethyl ester cyclase
VIKLLILEPVYDLFPLDKYKSICIPILGSRGCIFKCSFCSETVLWKRFRYRTAENLIEEFKFHLKNFGTNSFYIVDSLINGNMKELVKFCKIVIKENLDISWGGKASIRTQMSKEILTLMAKAGCTNIQYGIESGSPQVIRDMRKGFTVDIAKRVLRDTYEAGIFTGTFFLVGFPTETEEHYQETKQFLKDIECYIDEVIPGFGMGIQPGSEVYNDQDKFGISWNEKGEWFTKHSTIEQRENRVSDFRKFCNRLNVTIGG